LGDPSDLPGYDELPAVANGGVAELTFEEVDGLNTPTALSIEPHECPMRRLLLEARVDALELVDDERHFLDHGAKSKTVAMAAAVPRVDVAGRVRARPVFARSFDVRAAPKAELFGRLLSVLSA